MSFANWFSKIKLQAKYTAMSNRLLNSVDSSYKSEGLSMTFGHSELFEKRIKVLYVNEAS